MIANLIEIDQLNVSINLCNFIIDTQIKNIPMPEVVDLKAAGYIKSQIHGIAVD